MLNLREGATSDTILPTYTTTLFPFLISSGGIPGIFFKRKASQVGEVPIMPYHKKIPKNTEKSTCHHIPPKKGETGLLLRKRRLFRLIRRTFFLLFLLGNKGPSSSLWDYPPSFPLPRKISLCPIYLRGCGRLTRDLLPFPPPPPPPI